MSIYKLCGILGDAATQLSADQYRRWGFALGLQLEPGSKFVVGGDVRSSTPAFIAALVEGLCQAGLDVVDIGQLPTPMIYYARHRLNAAGCAIVTGSHFPANINGLRWLIDNRPPSPDDVHAMQIAAEGPSKRNRACRPTEPRSIDISFDYVANLQETWIDAMGAQQHIVIDSMNGCWAGKARRYLQAIFPQCLITTINDAADPEFGGQTPDCSNHQYLHNLCDAVYRERADLGIALDGDGDRVALVDNQGMTLTGEETAWILLETFGKKLCNEQFVSDLRFSDQVNERARQLGAEPIVERVGHEFILKQMAATNALFGAGIRGHYFFRQTEGADDTLYACCRIIAFLAETRKTLAQWRWECPSMYITPEISIDIPQESQAPILESIRREWSSFPQKNIDGVRIETPGGWILVRTSPNENALLFRFESIDWSALDDLVRRFCDTIEDLGEQLWQTYVAAMGTGVEKLTAEG